MKKNKGGVVKIVVITVAVFVLAFAFFSLTNSTGKVTGNQIASSDVGSTGTTDFGSLSVTSFTASLKGDKYTCNKEIVSSEEAQVCGTSENGKRVGLKESQCCFYDDRTGRSAGCYTCFSDAGEVRWVEGQPCSGTAQPGLL